MFSLSVAKRIYDFVQHKISTEVLMFNTIKRLTSILSTMIGDLVLLLVHYFSVPSKVMVGKKALPPNSLLAFE